MANPVALYDACVLYPAPLRDLLMHLAMTGLFRARWTNQIHEEWIRSVLENREDLTRAQLERTRDLMNRHAEDCLVEDYEDLIESVQLPDANDRHVLAAAIRGRVDVIVTYNARDFPEAARAPYSIDLQHPDEFVSQLFDLAPQTEVETVRRQRANLKNPVRSAADLLQTFESQQLVQTVIRLQPWVELL